MLRRRATGAIFLDVGEFAAGGELPIFAHDAAAGERREPQNPYETHDNSNSLAISLAKSVPKLVARGSEDRIGIAAHVRRLSGRPNGVGLVAV
jgi:hypothetical protein